MSLTNPNTVVTEQRLNEFYKGILPYLGGMPEMVANKFSKGDLYSTDEKMIGQWVDGKPLYQKTIEVNVTTSTNQGANIYTGEISLSTFFDFSTIDNMFFDIEHSFYVLGNVRGFVYGWVVKEASTVLIGTLYARSNVPSKLTFQYTKTTDTAISIGSDTDYSTEEKIVGTWIDGKPIYQKTIDCGGLPNNSTKEIAHGISNLDFIVHSFGITKRTSDGLCEQIPSPNTNDSFASELSITPSVIYITTHSDRTSFTKSYVTIQYTKTTT